MSWGRTSLAPTIRSVPFALGLDRRARSAELVDDAGDVLGDDAADKEIAGRQGPGDEKGACLDPVGDDGVGRPAELPDAVDAGRVFVRPIDLRAHLVEENGQVGDFGLAGAVLEHGLALGQSGGHEQVLRPRDRLLLEFDLGPAETVGLGPDVAVLEGDGRAELLQPGDVEVDRTRADGAAAGQGDDRLAEAGDERAENEDRGPHGPDELVGRFVRPDLRDAQGHPVPGRAVGAAEIGDERQDGLDILHLRDIREPDLLARQERCGDRRQDGVLGPAHADLTLQAKAGIAADEELFHQTTRPSFVQPQA